ncbi:unnamed protein product [Calypogeia fissa]
MSGTGTFSSSSFNGGGWTGAGGRPRASKLGATGINSKRRRTRRTLLQTAKRRLLNFLIISALLLIFALGIYNGSFFFVPPSSVSDGGETKSSSGWRSANGIGEVNTDITTKRLYDEIAFKDEEGGVWRQGWNVQYNGNEWDQEELKVIVVPHSHNDPGWLRTVEEYYQEKSRNILSTIVQALKKDKRRKFIWEEMSYLERWWRDASDVERKDFKHLVKTGQLEIVGGGWVMNDEANSHYYAIIQQMIAGNVWLLDTLGVAAKNAWAIDPFGHSPTMAYLLRRMGFNNMLIQRTHYEVKKALAREKNLEFMWRQGWDEGNTTDIFCHMMPFYSYDIPHTCGPDPSICCQFDFWRLPSAHSLARCPWGKDPVEINPENVKERAEMLLDQYKKKSTLYRSNTLLIPLGDDFRYTSIREADLQFTNLQKIFDHINSHAYLRAKVNFGTLQDYFTTLREEVGRASPIRATPDSVPGFPTLSGDFFTYSDVRQDYWSGYYVSRPFFKAMDRVLEETLRAADILFSLTLAHCQAEKSEFPFSSTSKLVSARRNLALFQHHDGVTGTAKTHVMQDYGTRIHSSVRDLQNLMIKSIRALLSKRTSSGRCLNHDQEEHDFYEPAQTRERYDLLPSKTVVTVTGDLVRRVVLFNSLEETLDQVVTVVVDEPVVCVFDSEWRPVPSQISPELDFGSGNEPGTGKHRLLWVAKVPPMGLQTYIVAPSASTESCILATAATLSVFNSPSDFTCPTHYRCSYQRDAQVVIENQHQLLLFDGHTGLLQGVEIKDVGEAVVVEEDLAFYVSRGSGAYLFEPTGEAKSFVQSGGLILVSKGPLMEEVYSRPTYELETLPVVRCARLYAGTSIQAGIAEMEYHTMLDQNSFNNMELIARFKTELNNKGLFYSDLNGFQMIRRETLDKIPLQGNYYPMPALAFIQCPGGRRFSIHSRQALGVASLGKGWLEVMLERRLLHDDSRGLGQGVLDNHKNSVVFHLLVEKNVSQTQNLDHSSSSSRLPSLLSHRAGAQLNYPLHAFLGRQEERAHIEESSTGKDPVHKLAFSPFTSKLPCDLHVVAMQPIDGAGITTSSKQNVGLLIQRRGFDDSYGVNKDLAGKEECSVIDDVVFPLKNIFQDLEISNTKLTSLNLAIDDDTEFDSTLQQVHRKEWGSKREVKPALIELGPLEIKGYKFQLRSSEKQV